MDGMYERSVRVGIGPISGEDVMAVARHDAQVLITDEAWAEVRKSREIIEALADHGQPAHVEGYNRSDRSGWILIDYFDFIVHVFARETLLFFDLERLWGCAERVDIPPAT